MEQLRKRIESDTVPTLKATVKLVLEFVKHEEEKFLKTAEKTLSPRT